MVEEMGDVVTASGGEVVDADDLVVPGEQLVAQVGAEEAGSAQDDDAAAHRRPIPT